MRLVSPKAALALIAPFALAACAHARREASPAQVTAPTEPSISIPTERPTADPAEPLRIVAAILRAEDRRMVDDALLAALADPRPDVRARGALALARIGDPATRSRMEQALEDASPAVRIEAAFGLGLLGDASTLPTLERASGDTDPLVRAMAAEALGRIGAEGAGPGVVRLLADPEPRVRAEACLSAWKLTDAGPAVDGLIEQSRAADAALRFAAAYALGRLGAVGSPWTSSGAAPSTLNREDRLRVRTRLVEMVTDPDPEVRMQVARGLASPEIPVETSGLATLARDPDPRVKINAVRALSYPDASVKTGVQAALTDRDPGVIIAAIEGLGRIRSPEARQLLLDGMKRAKGDWVRETALLALAACDASLVPLLAETYASDPSPRLREAAAKVLVGRTEREALELASRLLADPEPRVQAAAVPVVALYEGALEKLLGPAIASPDPVVRAAVAHAAGERIGRAGTWPSEREEAARQVERLWSAAERDSLPDGRLACLDAAARAGQEEWARAVLALGLESPDRRTRLRAAKHLRKVYGEDAFDRVGPASDRPLEDYVKVLVWAQRPRAAVVAVQRGRMTPGRFTMSLDTRGAPLTAWNFAELATKGFYDGLVIHRVVPNFVVQDGDPRGDGSGDPGYGIRDEFGHMRFSGGVVGMASDGKDTAGSQWFVTLSAQPHLDGRYTAFGRVIQNLSGVVQLIQPGDRVLGIRVYEGSGEEPLPPLK